MMMTLSVHRVQSQVTCSLSPDVQVPFEQHKTRLLHKALLMTKLQQLALCQLPCQLLVVLLCTLPAFRAMSRSPCEGCLYVLMHALSGVAFRTKAVSQGVCKN